MENVLQIVVVKACSVVALALAAALAGRYLRRPAIVHVLWIIVLLELLVPPVFEIGVLPRMDRPAAAVISAVAALPAPVTAPDGTGEVAGPAVGTMLTRARRVRRCDCAWIISLWISRASKRSIWWRRRHARTRRERAMCAVPTCPIPLMRKIRWWPPAPGVLTVVLPCSVALVTTGISGHVRTVSVARPLLTGKGGRGIALVAEPNASACGAVMPERIFASSIELPCLVGYSRRPKEPWDHERLPSALSPLIHTGRPRATIHSHGETRSPWGGR